MLYLGYCLLAINAAILFRDIQQGNWGMVTFTLVNTLIIGAGIVAKKFEEKG